MNVTVNLEARPFTKKNLTNEDWTPKVHIQLKFCLDGLLYDYSDVKTYDYLIIKNHAHHDSA